MKLAEFTKVAGMLAKEHKIKIQEGRGWAANIKNRDVFYRKEDIYTLPEDHILGLLLHEIAHIHYTTETITKDPHKELKFSTLNMIEDISIEHIISNDYPNAGEILASTKMEVLDTLVKMLPKMKDISIFEKALLYGATRFEGRGYEFGIEPYEKLGDEISKIMLRRQSEIYGRAQTKDLIPLVEEIVDLIVKEAGEPDEKQKRQLMQTNNGNASEQDETEHAKNKVIKGLKSGKGWKEGVPLANNTAFIDAIADQAAGIGKQLRTVLKRNNAMEYGGRYRTGKLMAKRFVRIKAMKDRNPFTRRIVKSNQSYAFAIAGDVSGSMFNESYPEDQPGSYALTSMHMVAEALKYAGIPRSLIIFGMKARVLTPMGRSRVEWSKIADELEIRRTNPGGTDISTAITACTAELNKVRAERKIMILLTDGSSDLYSMKEAHKKATNMGIECLGITIGDGGAEYYMDETFSEEKNTKIKSTKNTALIGKAFIDILKKSVAMSK